MNRTLRQGMPFLSFGVPYIFAYLFGLFTVGCVSRFMFLLLCFVSLLYRR